MKRLWTFLVGIVAGVAGDTLYYIYGKPTLPRDDQSWFWTKKWQEGEKEVNELIKKGEFETFDSMEEFIENLFGKPTLPSEIKEDGDWLPSGFLKGAKWYNKDGIPTDIHGNWIPAPDSLDDMGITQEIVIRDEEPSASLYEQWAEESE